VDSEESFLNSKSRPAGSEPPGQRPACRVLDAYVEASPSLAFDFFFRQKKMMPRRAAMNADFLLNNLIETPFVSARLA
jgi:hypothetical protein